MRIGTRTRHPIVRCHGTPDLCSSTLHQMTVALSSHQVHEPLALMSDIGEHEKTRDKSEMAIKLRKKEHCSWRGRCPPVRSSGTCVEAGCGDKVLPSGPRAGVTSGRGDGVGMLVKTAVG